MCIKRVVGIGGGCNLTVILGRFKKMGRSNPSYSDHRSEAGRGDVEVPCMQGGVEDDDAIHLYGQFVWGEPKNTKTYNFQRRKKTQINKNTSRIYSHLSNKNSS